MAKKGTEVYPDRDERGHWCLRIEKKCGRLTLEEIKEAARETICRNFGSCKEGFTLHWNISSTKHSQTEKY